MPSGAQITTGSSLDSPSCDCGPSRRNLSPSLEIYADVVLNPSFPQGMIDLGKRRRLAQIGQEKAQPVPAAQRVVAPLLFGPGHAYGNPLTGSGFESTVSALTRDDLVKWHRDWFHPANATLIVTGDSRFPPSCPGSSGRSAPGRPGQAPAKRIQPVPPTTAGRVYLIDKPGAPQSVIVAAHVSEPGGQAEDLAIETVMRNFGGMATSRLNRNLRLDKHWSYGTRAQLSTARGQRPFLVDRAGADGQDEGIDRRSHEGTARCRRGAADRGEEFASIMRTQTMSLPGRFATLASLEAAASQILNYRYADDYFSTYAQRVRNLGERDLDAAARKFIRPSEVIWVVVGDLKLVEAGVRELNLGEVRHLDDDGRPITQGANR